MPGETANGDHSGRAPTIGVVAPGRVARRLIPILKRDGLDARAASPARRSPNPDVLVIAVDSLSSGRSEIRQARDEHPSARVVLVVTTATLAEARQVLV